jgi:molybdopterin molybdotransferase
MLLPLDQALARLDQIVIPNADSETIKLTEALGRTIVGDVIAPFDLPAFDNSAVDGFAVRAADVSAGATLQVVGSSFAGQPFADVLHPGTAVRIATGGAMPPGADAIAMLELCDDRQTSVIIREAPQPGAQCRKAGQDVRVGAIVLPAGTRMTAPTLAMAASLGFETLEVRRRLRVAIASTGSELVENGPRRPGQIYDSNRILLKSVLQPYNVDIVDLGILPDEAEATRIALTKAAQEADLIITSGGVSVGARDYVRDTIETAGEVLFWRLAIKPGKPLLCGRLNGTPLIGVPGNPVSAYVTFQLACRPLLLRLMGAVAKPPLRIPVRLGFTHKKAAALREFARVTIDRDEKGLIAKPFRSQLSNLVSSLLESDGLADLPAGQDTIPEGQIVDFISWSAFAL